MTGMIEILIGIIIAAVIVAFIRNRTKNCENISWVFEKIKMSGLKFDLMCKLIAIGLLVIFYLLHSMEICKIFSFAHILFIYVEILVLFIAPLKAEAECCLLINEVPREAFNWSVVRMKSRRVERQKEVPLMSSVIDIWIVLTVYLKIINSVVYGDFAGCIQFIIIFDVLLLIIRIHDDKQFKKLEAKYYEERFSSYYRK